MRSKPYLLKKDWVTGQDESGEDKFLKVSDMIKGPKRLEDESYEDYKLRQKVENGLLKDRLAGLYTPNTIDEIKGKIKPIRKQMSVINCYKEDNPLIKNKLREVTVEEGLSIATKLFQILNERKDGIGLAANQVGIDAQVAVVNVIEPLVLINPKIISKENPIDFYEGCLSYPGQGVSTQRYRDIIVQTVQEECGWYFSGAKTGKEGKGSWEKDDIQNEQEQRLLESVCVQHEIDHLNGVTIFNRQVNKTPIQRQVKKYGRNEKVTIQKDNETRILKYKKAQNFLKQGWEIL